MSRIYVVRVEGFVKVGYAKDIKERMSCIKMSCPFDPELVIDADYRDSSCAYIAESLCHRKLKDMGLHWRGEWFAGPDKAVSVVRGLLNKYSPSEVGKIRERQIEMLEIKRQALTEKGKTVKELTSYLYSQGLHLAVSLIGTPWHVKKHSQIISEEDIVSARRYMER